ncbi:MAG: thiamine-phosphate kinase [bacterium]|nr:thiamine-phosphate kinase [bacterium]
MSRPLSPPSNAPIAQGGEAGVLAMVRAVFAAPGTPEIICGIGDDAAVLAPPTGARYQLITLDTLVESTHFHADDAPARVGWKAMAVNVSDIAAMGGTPTCALLSLALPAATPQSYLAALLHGMQRCAEHFGVTVIGGDTVGATQTTLSITMLGTVAPARVRYRHGAQPGDVMAVTGPLGGSLRSGHHLDFMPRVAEAQWLLDNAPPTAMMDVSDGLALDGMRMAQASSVTLQLHAAAIPCNAGVSLDAALHDGEDFELLCTIPAACVTAAVCAAFAQQFQRPLHIIGDVHAGAGQLLLDDAPITPRGYEHFAL